MLMVMEPAWQTVMSLAWDAYQVGTTPIGAVVLDASGRTVATASNRRHEDASIAGQLANSRIAHAELNALAQLPHDRYEDHALYTNVEPCCLCMGAVLQSGIGTVRYGWRDGYAGAASCMTVANPQVSRRSVEIAGPSGGVVEVLTGLLMASHYIYVRPGLDHVVAPWRNAQPEVFGLAANPAVADVVRDAAAAGGTVDDLVDALQPLIAL